MHTPRLILLVLAVAAAPLEAQLRPNVESAGVLRVCADPDNLPASSQSGEGYENRIAEFIAKAWNSRVEYAWWPVRRGFFSRALNGRYCDVAITAPAGLDMAGVTEPYFRSTYYLVYREDSGLDLRSLDDPAFKRLRIGVHLLNSDAENTPPAMALSSHGVVGNLVGFGTFYSEGGDRPEDIITAVVDRRVDVAIVWGPMAGYYARRAAPAKLVLRPVPDDSASGIPFAYSFGMATRRRDRALRDSLNALVKSRRSELQAILREFGVPMLPLAADSADRPAGAGGSPGQ